MTHDRAKVHTNGNENTNIVGSSLIRGHNSGNKVKKTINQHPKSTTRNTVLLLLAVTAVVLIIYFVVTRSGSSHSPTSSQSHTENAVSLNRKNTPSSADTIVS